MTDPAPAPTAGTFRSAWSHRRWRWLFSSFAVSLTGSFLYSVALVVFLIDRTGSATWVSAAVVARLIPHALLSAPAGVLADRFDRRKLMMRLDVALAVVMGLLAIVAWVDGPVMAAVVLAVAASALSTPYRPAAVAATPLLVGEDDLAAANAAESVVAQAAWFVGPALGAAVVALADPGWAFLVNGVTFGVSALLVSRIGAAGGGAQSTSGTEDESDGAIEPDSAVETEEPEGVAAQLAEGVRAVRSDPGLAALVIFVAALLFTFGMEQVLHVFVAVDRLGLGAEWVGVMGAAIGAGGLVIAPFTARMGRSPSIGMLLVISGVAVGLPMVALSLTTSPPLVLGVLAVEGAAIIVNEVLLITMLQRACPENMLARVFGLQESTSSITQLLGSVMAPVLVATAGLGTGLVVGGGVSVVASLLLAPALLTLAARTDRDRRTLAPTVARLRRLGIFTDASEAALERVARGVVATTVREGQIVIAEGDQPDDLYIVDAGQLVVRSRGETSGVEREVNRMGPEDWFGEIGLLRGIPRTATVETTTECQLLRVSGDVFIAALAEPDVLPDPVRRTMAVRLARTHPTTTSQQ